MEIEAEPSASTTRILHPDLFDETSSLGSMYREAVQRRSDSRPSMEKMADKEISERLADEPANDGDGVLQEIVGKPALSINNLQSDLRCETIQ